MITAILILAIAGIVLLSFYMIKDNKTLSNLDLTQNITIFYVDMRDYGFFPQNLTIERCEEVIWKNLGKNNQSIVFDGINQSSGILQPGDNYTFMFNYSGDFNYSFALHPELKGKITVK